MEGSRAAGLTFIEKILYGVVLTASLTVALAWSPVWDHIASVSTLFPARHAVLLEALPGEPNTTLAFFVILALVYGILFFLREPTAGLGVVAAAALGTAAYPYGQVMWHRLVGDLPLLEASLTLGTWLRALVPVLLLLVPPVVAHLRSTLQAYEQKGVDAAERGLIGRHLVRSAGVAAGVSVVLALFLGTLIRFGAQLIATETRLLGRNSAVVLIVAALLIIFGLGLGTDLFAKKEPPAADPEERHPEAS